MVVWRIEDGAEVLRLFEKSYLTEKWPTIKWTPNEEIAGINFLPLEYIYNYCCRTYGEEHYTYIQGTLSRRWDNSQGR